MSIINFKSGAAARASQYIHTCRLSGNTKFFPKYLEVSNTIKLSYLFRKKKEGNEQRNKNSGFVILHKQFNTITLPFTSQYLFRFEFIWKPDVSL